METDIAGLEDEQVITYYALQNEALKTLTQQYRTEVSPLRAESLSLRAQIMEYMVANNCHYLQVAPDVLLRKTLRQAAGKDVTPDVVQQVAAELCGNKAAFTDLVAELAADQARRLAAWKAKQTRARKGKLGTAAAFAATAQPPEPAPRFVGKDKMTPRRMETPIGRPMTPKELVAEVLFTAVHKIHKPSKPLLVKCAAPIKNMAVVDAAATPLAAAAAKYAETLVLCGSACAPLAAARKSHRLAMSACAPALREYVATLDPESHTIKRTMPTEDGDRVVTICVREKVVKARSLSLWDLSQIVDACVEEAFAGKAVDAADAYAVYADLAPGLIDRLVARLKTALETKHTKTACVCIRRTNPKRRKTEDGDTTNQAEEGEEDESEEEGDDDEDEGDEDHEPLMEI
jgi:hypothetical protein